MNLQFNFIHLRDTYTYIYIYVSRRKEKRWDRGEGVPYHKSDTEIKVANERGT